MCIHQLFLAGTKIILSDSTFITNVVKLGCFFKYSVVTELPENLCNARLNESEGILCSLGLGADCEKQLFPEISRQIIRVVLSRLAITGLIWAPKYTILYSQTIPN